MQHEDTRTAMGFAGLTAHETWMHYCSMGGPTDFFEFGAYLVGLHPLEFDDADLVSQAVNELIDDSCPDEANHCRAPYSWRPTATYSAVAPDTLDPPMDDVDGPDGTSMTLPRGSFDDAIGDSLGAVARPDAGNTFGSRLLSGLDLRAISGRAGIPCPPGSEAELLGDILDSGVIGRIVHRGTPDPS